MQICSFCNKELPNQAALTILGSYLVREQSYDILHPKTGEKIRHFPYQTFWACDPCAAKEKLAWYEIQHHIDNVELSRFRNLMFTIDPNKAEYSYVKSARVGWEALDLDLLLRFLDLLESSTKAITEIVNRKASREDITKLLKEKTKEAQETHKKNVAAVKAKANGGLSGEYDKDTRKAVLSLMKTLRVSETQAANMIKGKK